MKNGVIILHELDDSLLCDVCKRGYFVFYRVPWLDGYSINPACSHCYEEKSSISEKNFVAWCEQYHPELVDKAKLTLTALEQTSMLDYLALVMQDTLQAASDEPEAYGHLWIHKKREKDEL